MISSQLPLKRQHLFSETATLFNISDGSKILKSRGIVYVKRVLLVGESGTVVFISQSISVEDGTLRCNCTMPRLEYCFSHPVIGKM